MSNAGNLVNRICLQRRYRNIAISVAVVAIGVAVAGWVRPPRMMTQDEFLKSIHAKFHIQTDCETYAETMCNN